MANQFTRAEEQGLDKPKGANQFTTGKRTGHDQATKDRMRAEKAADLLEQELEGTVELPEGRRAAAKILMEYGKPKLAAITQTTVSEFDSMSEDELYGMVSALITSNPGLIERLGIKPQLVQSLDPEAHNHHKSDTESA